jgi:hypothetical protein
MPPAIMVRITATGGVAYSQNRLGVGRFSSLSMLIPPTCDLSSKDRRDLIFRRKIVRDQPA